tara:strand:- start:1392 stop:1745 length:354 start_codon:yes stop_codon:yes gene_type:complete
MSWEDILKKKSRKKSFSAYDAGKLIHERAKFARNKFRGEKPTSRYMPEPPKPTPTSKPKPTPKPKRQIPARTIVDNYFEMYASQGKGEPTMQDIIREEGRPLTIDEEQSYYNRKQRE